MDTPGVDKAALVQDLYKELKSEHLLAKTELLVYSTTLRVAGQVDLLMRNEDKSEYYLYDYKFIKKPIDKKSYYNHYTKKYKMMKGPFKHLMDCNYSHYSIQMELYKYLMGNVGKKVVKKALIVVNPKGYNIVDGIPMKIWVDNSGLLQAAYKDFRGNVYNSSKDPDYLENPYKLI